ncbi:hypothetical protein DID77_01630, partial [Candidatus Marinamargulisbacteria bacterium SCGC AG-439-L15]
AGFSLLPERVAEFEVALQEKAQTLIKEEDLGACLEIDACLSTEDLTMDLIKEIQCLAPYGFGNPDPLFYTKELIPVDFKTVGNGKHLKATFSDRSRKRYVDAIGFGLASKIDVLYKESVELVFQLEVNNWTGMDVLQLNMVDLK